MATNRVKEMRFCIIIPAHNEEKYLGNTLQSLVEQTLQPTQLIIVNDNSTDNTQEIIDSYTERFSFISSIYTVSSDEHLPGSKIIRAFNSGLKTVLEPFDIICKFDADLIFPKNYLETLSIHFDKDDRLGMASGFCYIKDDNTWQLEDLTRKDHIRGALKAYRKECFEEIGGLGQSIGWDTADEMKAMFHGWKILTLPNLKVKHLKPTGNRYSKQSDHLQGEAFYKLRYGFPITFITAVKMMAKKKNPKILNAYLNGYFAAKAKKIEPLVSEEEGKFIRKLRWKGIKEKFS